jgi:hypothetical protein
MLRTSEDLRRTLGTPPLIQHTGDLKANITCIVFTDALYLEILIYLFLTYLSETVANRGAV